MRRFFYTLKQAFLQVLRNRAKSVASIFAITAMLLILSIFFILVINVNTAAQTIQQDYDSIEIYLKDDVTKEQANDIIMQVKEEKGVEDAYYKSKEAAMENFRNRWGDNAYLLDSLNENPLPNSVVVMIGDLNYVDLPDHRLHRGGIQYHQADGVQQSRRNQHHEIRGSDQLVYSRAVPGRGHYYRNHICRHIRRDIGTAVSEDHRCDRSTGIFGVINADGTGRLPDL